MPIASSLPSTAPVPAILDIEASGFGAGSYPIEIGFVLPDGAGFCTLIRPLPEWTHWDPAAERVHGITRLAAQCHGRAAPKVAQLLNEQLHGMTVYCDAWAHDYAWLHILFAATGEQPSFRLEHVISLIPQDEIERWPLAKQAAAEQLHLRRHRASNDARVLQRALTCLHAPPGQGAAQPAPTN